MAVAGSVRLNTEAYYDAFSARYDRGRDHGYHALVDRLELEVALRYARDADVLEAGCGTGRILQGLGSQARRAVGVDLSSGMLSHAARRRLGVAQASITKLPFADDSFDMVCSFKVLAHVVDIGAAIAELSRVVRPGGHLVLEFYNPYSLRALLKRLLPPTPTSPSTTDASVYTRYDSLSQVRAMLPPGHEIVGLRGVRVLTPAATLHDVWPLGVLLEAIEKRICDAPGLRRLGGFMIVVVRKAP